LALIRLISMLGDGAVLFLTPIVFHEQAFSASRITEGLALAALAGTAGRLLSGVLLDRGLRCSVPVLLAFASSLLGDIVLFGAESFSRYLLGQLLLGIAMGLYWPAIELAVPLSCAPLRSAQAFALVRSADAAGVAAGVLIGALLASQGWLRGIFLVDISCLLVLTLLLWRRPLPATAPQRGAPPPSPIRTWLPPLLPILTVTVLATAMPALMQSALPLMLVRGGLERAPLPESLGALTVGLQLALLLLAQLPLAMGEAAFLPTATEAVVELTPERHRGLAMALFSQCFALSAFVAPLLAGLLLDIQGHSIGLWLTMTVACLLGLPLVLLLERFQRSSLLDVLIGAAGADGRTILLRFNRRAVGPGRAGSPPLRAADGEADRAGDD
jgi:MFS family permease